MKCKTQKKNISRVSYAEDQTRGNSNIKYKDEYGKTCIMAPLNQIMKRP